MRQDLHRSLAIAASFVVGSFMGLTGLLEQPGTGRKRECAVGERELAGVVGVGVGGQASLVVGRVDGVGTDGDRDTASGNVGRVCVGGDGD